MNSILGNGQNFDLIKKALDATAIRGKVIANNIANINTPNYKRLYVSFEDALNESMSSSYNGQVDANEVPIIVSEDGSSSMRLDGNNVDIDIEKSNQAANTLMNNLLITQVNNRLASMKYVIEGK